MLLKYVKLHPLCPHFARSFINNDVGTNLAKLPESRSVDNSGATAKHLNVSGILVF